MSKYLVRSQQETSGNEDDDEWKKEYLKILATTTKMVIIPYLWISALTHINGAEYTPYSARKASPDRHRCYPRGQEHTCYTRERIQTCRGHGKEVF